MEVDCLFQMDPSKLLEVGRRLLEIDFSPLYNGSMDNQLYWLFVMKAAHKAGRRATHLSC